MTGGRAKASPSDTTSLSDTIDMSVDLAGMRLPNPLMTASGCAANGKELHRFFDIAELGAFVTKTVLAEPRSGRGTPRMAETPSGMLNSIGLQGPGVNDFARNDLVWLKSVGARVLASIAGNTAGEYADVAAVLRASPAFDAVVGIEVNISCPNVANRGLVFACVPTWPACPEDCPVPPSVRWQCAPSGRCAPRCLKDASRRSRSLVSGECAPATTRCSWSRPERARSRLEPRRSTTPAHPSASTVNWPKPCRTKASHDSAMQ